MAGKGREPALRRDQREEVLALYTEGKYTQKQLAWMFRVKIGVIERIVRPVRAETDEDLALVETKVAVPVKANKESALPLPAGGNKTHTFGPDLPEESEQYHPPEH